MTDGDRSAVSLDGLTRLARRFFEVPGASLSVVQGGREVVRSCSGLELPNLPLAGSFAEAVLGAGGVLVVEDCRADQRLRRHPLVAGPPGIRFLAGAALPGPGRPAVLAVVDFEPRRMPPEYVEDLVAFAALAGLVGPGRAPSTRPPGPGS